MLKLTLASLMLAAALNANASASLFEDEMAGIGSNDTFATAQNLGSLALGDITSILGARHSDIPGGNSDDFFKFTVNGTGNLKLSLITNDANQFGTENGGDPYLYFYNAKGEWLAQDDDSGYGYNSFLSFNVAAPTSYYAVVRGWNGSPNWPLYSLNIDATNVAPVPEPETYALMGMGLLGLLAARRRKAA